MNRRLIQLVIPALLFSLLVSLLTSQAYAYKPEDPEVRAMVNKGIKYLESKGAFMQPNIERLGGISLVALAIYKGSAKPDKNHPVVQAAVKRCLAEAAKPIASIKKLEDSNYSICIAAVLLSEVDAQKHRAAIDKLLSAVISNQQSGGGWGYIHGSEADGLGDTSQTQYGVLASWTAQKKGIPVSNSVFEKAAGWLIRTQDVTGAHAYKPRDAGQKIAQASRKTQGLTAAGAGSIYICGDALNLFAAGRAAARQQRQGPLREVKEKGEDTRARSSMNPATLLAGAGAADRYFDSRFALTGGDSFYYMLYAIERYMTFRDKAHGNKDPEPRWYNAGVEYCQKAQDNKLGAWESATNGRAIPTAFAILFLIRSTQKSLGTVNITEGFLRGGRGLPKDVTRLREGKDGEVLGKKEIRSSFDDLFAVIESTDDKTNYEELVAKMPTVKIDKKDTKKRDAEMEKLKARISHSDYRMRLVAVTSLARNGGIDEVPALIFALTDPDENVAKRARNGLRFISRKFDGFKMPDRPNEAQKKQARADWIRWYRSVRPNGKLIID